MRKDISDNVSSLLLLKEIRHVVKAISVLVWDKETVLKETYNFMILSSESVTLYNIACVFWSVSSHKITMMRLSKQWDSEFNVLQYLLINAVYKWKMNKVKLINRVDSLNNNLI